MPMADGDGRWGDGTMDDGAMDDGRWTIDGVEEFDHCCEITALARSGEGHRASVRPQRGIAPHYGIIICMSDSR